MITKQEKEILFDAEKTVYETRELIKKRGTELSHREFCALCSGVVNGVVSALNTLDIKMSEDFEKEAHALMSRVMD